MIFFYSKVNSIVGMSFLAYVGYCLYLECPLSNCLLFTYCVLYQRLFLIHDCLGPLVNSIVSFIRRVLWHT